MRQAAAVKLFVVIIICTVYLISFSQIGAFAYQSFFEEPNRFAEGTMIGTVSVSKQSNGEAVHVVQEKVNQWKESAAIQLIYQENKETIPAQLFTFQVERSVKQAVNGQRSLLIVQLDEPALIKRLKEMLPPSIFSSINLEKLKQDMTAMAANLVGKQSIDLANYVVSQPTEQPISAATIENLGESRAEIIAWVSNHPTIELKGKSVFSLSAYFRQTNEPLSSEAMSLIASAVYEAVLPTNFTVLERHTSRELPDGIRLGYEARVDQDKRDFCFYNPNTSTYTLQLKAVNNGFSVTLTGLPLIHKYVVSVDGIEYFSPKTIVQYSSLLQPNERRVKQEGKQGMLAKVKKEIYDENHHLLKTEVVAEDFYPPVPAIEVRGLKLGIDTSNNATTPTSGTNEEQPPSEQSSQQSETETTTAVPPTPSNLDQYEK
ncbi:G5 domain-containing protein [Thermaerobacillus caldiproteolyticus]|uniref:G5 domain-containing protein n=1 Tax=Thermaerobacillus caldiproteolyticus TaxID=247480 RepID=UPI00188A43AB|nr:G5 domain-containing protein [Anoxybacillus caldiproteolyticus]QPA30242.1 G5 domain-containing protein [Anoxybacillus caldiproteolyticus]